MAANDARVLIRRACDRRRRAPGRDRDAARKHPHAGVHAGRHHSDVKAMFTQDVRAAGRRHSARQCLSSDAASRRGADRATRRLAQVHALARPILTRLGRLSGDVLGQAPQARRERGHFPIRPLKIRSILVFINGRCNCLIAN